MSNSTEIPDWALYVLVILLSISAFCWGMVSFMKDPHKINKPYIILYDKPTQQDHDRCKADDNCMDVMSIDVLPSRED